MTTPYSGATSGGQPDLGPMTTPISTTTPARTEMTQNYGPDTMASAPAAGAMGTAMTAESRPDVEGTSVGQLIGEVTKDLSTLMRQELELAQAEMKVEAKKAGQGAGMFGAAGFAGYMTLLFLSVALWWALAHLVGHSWSALIVAILWGAVGAVAFVMGRNKFRQVNPKPERTLDTLSQVPSTLKPH